MIELADYVLAFEAREQRETSHLGITTSQFIPQLKVTAGWLQNGLVAAIKVFEAPGGVLTPLAYQMLENLKGTLSNAPDPDYRVAADAMRGKYEEERLKHEKTLTPIALAGALIFPGTIEDHRGWMSHADLAKAEEIVASYIVDLAGVSRMLNRGRALASLGPLGVRASVTFDTMQPATPGLVTTPTQQT